MADLGGNGRAANGGARSGGPVPVTQSDRSNIMSPTQIMRRRNERDAEKERTAAEERRKADEERRKSAERRAQAAGVTSPPTTVEQASPRPLQPAIGGTGESGYGTYPPSGASRQPEKIVPTAAAQTNLPSSNRLQDTAPGAQYRRPRANSQQQQQQPYPVQSTAPASPSDSRRPPPVQQHARRPSVPLASSQPGPSTAAPQHPPPPSASLSAQPRNSTTSAFPHAFERWETLSSHWEGLTSYWIRRLEQNTDEVRKEPLAQQMSRQITDLSAAGANLFHAVVELQRLRASSERKFQRWFYEHKEEQERAREREAELLNSLRVEREARETRTVSPSDFERVVTEKNNADRMVQEMRRELQISKEEARRAWEELGRREQEERDRTFSLREGQPTVIGGVQVVPMAQGMGRHGSVSQRTRPEEPYAASSASQGLEQHYSYEEGQSPTDTDPFTEGRHMAHPPHEPDVSRVAQGTYVPSGAGASSSRQGSGSRAPEPLQVTSPLQPRQPTTSARPAPAQRSSSNPEAFYQQSRPYLHGESGANIPEGERSGVTSRGDENSEGDEEYAIDEFGNFLQDTSGRRIPFRALHQQESDEFDVQEARRREIEHLQRYGTAVTGPIAYGTTTSAGPSQQGGSYPSSNAPDYSGSDYGSEWMHMRHHHPTRLSDVMEEDERSRASPSRASQASRGMFT
jgi:hypothetical protein